MELISENTQSTVVAQFEHKASKRTTYQSEAELEAAFIQQLRNQGYEYLNIHTQDELILNLRRQLERLNHITFTDEEWRTLFTNEIAKQSDSIKEKTAKLQDDTTQLLLNREDGTQCNVLLLDKQHIHENHLQVLNQYTPDNGTHKTRYDVTILVNGLPMVHIELKRRGVAIKEAFNQIRRYNRESFWADCGLFEYIQLFVISNGTDTKYYSNTTRASHIREATTHKQGRQQTSNSFEFTSFWADEKNTPITDLEDFTATFFQKHTILNILIRYCVFTSQDLLLVMRPYQICATEAILQRILIANNKKWYGSRDAGGYIWHTTGSGKTLTSFKTAILASKMDDIDKVLFVVDRKDLDYQTMKEYDKFKKGAANSNKSTKILTEQLEDDKSKIIITTIQKLSTFIKKNDKHDIYDKKVVLVFDECHRSQFGDMHDIIVKRFKKYFIFGFTGTPIFPENAVNKLKTTDSTFGKRLHTYTVISAIADQNVLPFRVDYIKTIKMKEGVNDEQVKDIEREEALLAPARITEVVRYILENYDRKTKRNSWYKLADKRVHGFNSIFATASITADKLYYEEFKRQQAALTPEQRLKIATIFSYAANEEEAETGSGFLDEENSDSTTALDQSSRDFLAAAIADYNQMFGTNFSTDDDKFGNYYKDVSERMKNRELDMLIVVNMFLTGFDATTLNTLWVDKNLRQHGLMQAYSRTNRILNTIKTFGNIVCFRNLENETNEALKMFGDGNREVGTIVLLRTFDEYFNGYEDEKGKHQKGYKEIVEDLQNNFPIGQRLLGEKAEKDFILLFGTYLRAVNILSTFDQYEQNRLMSDYEEQDYRSRYLDLKDKYRPQEDGDVVNINDDLVFELELIKQVEINIDYILQLIEQSKEDGSTAQNEIRIRIEKCINSSPSLRNKKELIQRFIERYSHNDDIHEQWLAYVREQAEAQLNTIVEEEKLKAENTHKFIEQSFQLGKIDDQGTAIVQCLPPVSMFSKDNRRTELKNRVIAKLKEYFERFYDIIDFRTEKMINITINNNTYYNIDTINNNNCQTISIKKDE